MTNIVFLHGRLSTPETSNSAKAIKEHFEDAFNIYTPDYKPNECSYIEILEYLHSYIKEHCDLSEEIIFIGISLGGFWAARMTSIFKFSKCILLNPSLNYYGIGHTAVINESTELTVILNEDDELLDSYKTKEYFENRADTIMLKTGGHRMANMKEVLTHIEKAVYNEVW